MDYVIVSISCVTLNKKQILQTIFESLMDIVYEPTASVCNSSLAPMVAIRFFHLGMPHKTVALPVNKYAIAKNRISYSEALLPKHIDPQNSHFSIFYLCLQMECYLE